MKDEKAFAFLTGMPRSGSTLLGSLLNQHPDIFVSPHSALPALMWAGIDVISTNESANLVPQERYTEFISKIPMYLYHDVKQKVVIDKAFHWATPGNINVAKSFSSDVKLIFPYRPLIEILASFVSILDMNPDNDIDAAIQTLDFYPKYYLSKNDARAEFIMMNDEYIGKPVLAFMSSQQKEYKHYFHLVSYNYLVNNTQSVVSSIFHYLGLDDYELDLNNVKNPYKYRDQEVLRLFGLHDIREKISRMSPNPQSLFSDYILEKYGSAYEKIGL